MNWTEKTGHMKCGRYYYAIKPDGYTDIVYVTFEGLGAVGLRDCGSGRSLEDTKGWLFSDGCIVFPETPAHTKPAVVRERTLLERLERILPHLEHIVAARKPVDGSPNECSWGDIRVSGGDPEA